MIRKNRIGIALATLAVSLTAITGVAGAAGSDTKVSIKGQNGDYYGYVKSSDPADCAEDRTVTVFKQLGSVQDPKSDQKIGSDTASLNGSKSMWSIGNSGYKTGDFYAKAAKVPGFCKAATSKTISRVTPHDSPPGQRQRPGGFGRRAVCRFSARRGSRSAPGSRPPCAVSAPGPAAPLERRLLAQDRAADDRPADVAERLRRDPQRRRVDEREAAGLVAAVERQRGQRAADHVRGADAVAGVAEARSGSPGSSSAITGRWLGETSIGPPQAWSIRRPVEPGEEAAAGGARPRRLTPGSTSARPSVRAPKTTRAAAPAEGDPPVGGGAEVVDHRPRVGDALAAGPADLLEHVGHRLGDHHVAGGQR